MGCITVNRTMAQFGCKLSCRSELWNARESRLDGRSYEAVEINAKLDMLLAVNVAFDTLVERGQDFDTTAVKEFKISNPKSITFMRSTFSILPYTNRNKVKADGTISVLCCITINGKSSTMATSIYARPVAGTVAEVISVFGVHKCCTK